MITIHVGLPKTGSSSIQLALKQRKLNGSFTLLVPREGGDDTENGWRKQISQIGKSQAIIFSNEGVLGNPLLGFPEIHDRLQLIQCAVGSRPSQIVIYVRAHLEWLVSMYLQELQGGGVASPEDFWSTLEPSPLLQWSNLLNTLEEESGVERVVIRAFDGSRNVVDDFFHLLSLGSPRYSRPSPFRENVSIRPVQAPLLLALNKQRIDAGLQTSPYRNLFQLILASGAPPTGSPFPDSLQEHILRQFKSDWDALTNTVALRDPIEGQRFAEIGAKWSQAKQPFVGYDLQTAAVRDEALRSLAELAEYCSVTTPTIRERLINKVRHSPMSIPAAAGRQITRGISSAARLRRP